MFNQTAKTKGKTAKPLAIPGAKKKSSKTTAAHRRGHVPSKLPVKAPKQLSQESIDQEESATGAEAGETGVEDEGNEDGHEDEGGPCIEDCGSIAEAIQGIKARRKGSQKYDLGTNTYR